MNDEMMGQHAPSTQQAPSRRSSLQITPRSRPSVALCTSPVYADQPKEDTFSARPVGHATPTDSASSPARARIDFIDPFVSSVLVEPLRRPSNAPPSSSPKQLSPRRRHSMSTFNEAAQRERLQASGLTNQRRLQGMASPISEYPRSSNSHESRFSHSLNDYPGSQHQDYDWSRGRSPGTRDLVNMHRRDGLGLGLDSSILQLTTSGTQPVPTGLVHAPPSPDRGPNDQARSLRQPQPHYPRSQTLAQLEFGARTADPDPMLNRSASVGHRPSLVTGFHLKDDRQRSPREPEAEGDSPKLDPFGNPFFRNRISAGRSYEGAAMTDENKKKTSPATPSRELLETRRRSAW